VTEGGEIENRKAAVAQPNFEGQGRSRAKDDGSVVVWSAMRK
jgi:hypothetical protein